MRGLGTDIYLWKRRIVNWKCPNLGACELKMSKFRGLRAKIWAKIEAVEAKISKFSQKEVFWTDSFAWNMILANYRRGVKWGLRGPTSPHPPFLGQCPQGPYSRVSQLILINWILNLIIHRSILSVESSDRLQVSSEI